MQAKVCIFYLELILAFPTIVVLGNNVPQDILGLVTKLANDVDKLKLEISGLTTKNNELENKLRAQDMVIERFLMSYRSSEDNVMEDFATSTNHVEDNERDGNSYGRNSILDNDIIDKTAKQKKRILPTQIEKPAFYAYVSHTENNPSPHVAIKFDIVRTNVGSAYNKYTGAFTSPVQGTYVFTWTIYSEGHSEIFTELILNDEAVCIAAADSETVTDTDTSTATVVLALEVKDVVYIRTQTHRGLGTIRGNYVASSTFAGWMIS